MQNMTQDTSTIVAPAGVLAHSCAESIKPAAPENVEINRVYQNISDAFFAKFLAAAAGTTSNAVTSNTPAVRTATITVAESNAANRY